MAVPSLDHFTDIELLDADQVWGLLHLARRLKEEYRCNGTNQPILRNRSLALLFQKPSLRTRVSFEMGMQHLGGYAFYLSPQEVGLGVRESPADVARALSGYVNGVMARVFDHDHILQLVEWGSIPVINGLSDYSHPCQALTDIFTVWEAFGRLEGVTLAYVGDGANNVATSLIAAADRVGMNILVVSPKGYQPDAAVLARFGAEVAVSEDPTDVRGVDVLYTDVWTSMGQEHEREARMAVFPPYQLNRELVAMAQNAHVKIMHCLPAHRGEEITDDVADGAESLIFPQAHNRLHAQKAVLAHLLGKVPLG